MTRSIDFLKTENEPHTGWSVNVEDDGRVCYAYLVSAEGRIVSDVWLYNRCGAPAEPEWTDREKAPFANPQGFSGSVDFPLPGDETDVAVRWSRDEEGCVLADVLIGGLVIGRLRAGEKPGWARAAVKDGPLAKMMR